MEISQDKLNKINEWLKNISFNTWLPIDSDLTEDHVLHLKELLYRSDLFMVEFNANFTKIRKFDFSNYSNLLTNNEGFYGTKK